MSFYDIVAYQATIFPARDAIVSGLEHVSYAKLLGRLTNAGSWLAFHGAGPGDVVMIETAEPVALICTIFAGLDLGCQVLPIHPRLSAESRRSIQESVKPLIVVQGDITRYDPGLRYFRFRDWIPGRMLHLTSGSYGAQKIVSRPLANLLDEGTALASRLDLSPGRRVLAMTPIAHSLGCGVMRATLMSGATLYVPSSEEILPKLGQLHSMMAYGVDYMFGVPYLFQALIRHWYGVDSPRSKTVGFAGGEPLLNPLADSWHQITGGELLQEYGLGEGGITTLGRPGDDPESIGSPLSGVSVTVEAPDERGVGELIVRRPFAPDHYYWRESPETFLEAGGVRTGDLGKWRNGKLYLVGRIKSVIIVAGMKVVPAEIEAVLRQATGVEEAVVIPMKDEFTGERPIAFVKATSPAAGSAEHLRRIVRDRLESYKVPAVIRFVDEFPRTGSGKVDRVALQAYV